MGTEVNCRERGGRALGDLGRTAGSSGEVLRSRPRLRIYGLLASLRFMARLFCGLSGAES